MIEQIFIRLDTYRMIAACLTCPGGEYLHPQEAQIVLEQLTPDELETLKSQFLEKVLDLRGDV